MPISVRLLRAAIQPKLDQRLPLSDRDLQRREAILDFAQRNMALFGRPNLSFRRFAEAIRLSPCSIRRLFADMDALLGEILRRHLASIAHAIGEIPPDAPGAAARQRAAYRAATRKPLGGFNDAHLLLLRDRHLLPEDELASVEAMRDGIATLLGGTLAQQTLDLLDAAHLSAAQIEFLLEQLPKTPGEAEPSAQPRRAPETAPPTTRKTLHPGQPARPNHRDDPPFLLPLREQHDARAGPPA